VSSDRLLRSVYKDKDRGEMMSRRCFQCSLSWASIFYISMVQPPPKGIIKYNFRFDTGSFKLLALN
jgi:hypothetical protein